MADKVKETWERDWIGERNARVARHNYLLSEDILFSSPSVSNNDIIIGKRSSFVSFSDVKTTVEYQQLFQEKEDLKRLLQAIPQEKTLSEILQEDKKNDPNTIDLQDLLDIIDDKKPLPTI